jgi:hypothetical protein
MPSGNPVIDVFAAKFYPRLTWGRCYDHNFLRFFPIFGEKLAFFLYTNVMINFFQNLALFWVKNANFFAKCFGEKIKKIITSVPARMMGSFPMMVLLRCRASRLGSSALTRVCDRLDCEMLLVLFGFGRKRSRWGRFYKSRFRPKDFWCIFTELWDKFCS